MKVELVYNTGKRVIRDLTVKQLFSLISMAPADSSKARVVESNLMENISEKKKSSAKWSEQDILNL
tara:strand:+ start:86 stop:283 length:198 start_codon:yes stop_codon:yes gene_type:complete